MHVANTAVIIYCMAELSLCTVHRKSRIVNVVESLHKAVDEHCEQRLSVIQKAKERHAYELKAKARLPLCVAVLPCMRMYGIECMCVCTPAMLIVHWLIRMIDSPVCILPCGMHRVVHYTMHRRRMRKRRPVPSRQGMRNEDPAVLGKGSSPRR